MEEIYNFEYLILDNLNCSKYIFCDKEGIECVEIFVLLFKFLSDLTLISSVREVFFSILILRFSLLEFFIRYLDVDGLIYVFDLV